MKDMGRSIVCPVSWCTGSLGDHGGFGDEPENWAHTDGAGTPLADGWALARSQVGGGPISWEVVAHGTEVLRAASPAQIAEQLAALAGAVEKVAP